MLAARVLLAAVALCIAAKPNEAQYVCKLGACTGAGEGETGLSKDACAAVCVGNAPERTVRGANCQPPPTHTHLCLGATEHDNLDIAGLRRPATWSSRRSERTALAFASRCAAHARPPTTPPCPLADDLASVRRRQTCGTVPILAERLPALPLAPRPGAHCCFWRPVGTCSDARAS